MQLLKGISNYTNAIYGNIENEIIDTIRTTNLRSKFQKICSLALKILGGLLIVTNAFELVKAIATIPMQGLGISFASQKLILLILGCDFAEMGRALRQKYNPSIFDLKNGKYYSDAVLYAKNTNLVSRLIKLSEFIVNYC